LAGTSRGRRSSPRHFPTKREARDSMTRLAFGRRGGTLPPYPSRRGEIEELVALTGIKYLTKLPRRRREET
jgi:hypothetical protein